MMFEIKWKAGDVTWLPLAQVEKLEALLGYLETVGVESVKELPLGKGVLPSDQPELIVAGIRFGPVSNKKTKGFTRRTRNQPGATTYTWKPHPTLPNTYGLVPYRSRQSSRRTQSSMSTIFTTIKSRPITGTGDWIVNSTFQYLRCVGPHILLSTDVVTGEEWVFSAMQVGMFHSHDADVRKGITGKPTPAGYSQWSSNWVAEGRPDGFMWENSEGIMMGGDREAVDLEMLQVGFSDCFMEESVLEFLAGAPGHKLFSPEQIALYDRLVMISASRSASHEERVVKRGNAKRARELDADEKPDTETAIKKLKFTKVKAEEVKPAAETKAAAEAKPEVTPEQLAAKKLKREAKSKAKKEKKAAESKKTGATEAMDVDA
ncbi:hypothetical protein B0H16DRAFT_1447159 [Mycena metata]|uniref:Uncharacterized protein n=1 Tax=Mycena metata TaxID=1033252 RepID=A0AAD7P0R7_9AGAR|nr:hypothetical protein B0H16DRAFT_1447159 [Mycena metata]